jgi:hypothetical protein
MTLRDTTRSIIERVEIPENMIVADLRPSGRPMGVGIFKLLNRMPAESARKILASMQLDIREIDSCDTVTIVKTLLCSRSIVSGRFNTGNGMRTTASTP